jgi:ribosomal protein S18 acetylase RimI-like enzyme
MNTIPAKRIEVVPLDEEGLLTHLEVIADILHACVHDGANVGFIVPFDLDDARAFWFQKIAPGIAAKKRIVLIAKFGDQVAGTVQLNLDTPPNQPHRADVSKLLVHPKYRMLGVGRALMEEIEQRAAKAGRRLLTLDTATDIAESLYSLSDMSAPAIFPVMPASRTRTGILVRRLCSKCWGCETPICHYGLAQFILLGNAQAGRREVPVQFGTLDNGSR